MFGADPAEEVDPAIADVPERVDAATADSARAEEYVEADAPLPVDPAVTAEPPASRPEKGASNALSVESLRKSCDFCSYAAVLQGPPNKDCLKRWFPRCFDERDFVAYGEIKKYCLVQNTSCFIFLEDTSEEPLYAVDLTKFKPFQEDPNDPDPLSVTISPVPNTNRPRPEMVTILLKDKKNGSQAYQFTFDTQNDAGLAKRFLDVVSRACHQQVVEAQVISYTKKTSK